MAFDTLHALRTSNRLPKARIQALAAMLDFGACANAAFDAKGFCRNEFRATRQLLKEAGMRSEVVAYLRRLRKLERTRPSRGELTWQFHDVKSYREAVVRASLESLAATFVGSPVLRYGMRATYCDTGLELLFRIVMQCQIIDDVVDYPKDASAELPSFLTASDSLLQACELTGRAMRAYADGRTLEGSGELFPFRVALGCLSACATAALLLGRWRHWKHFRRASRNVLTSIAAAD